MSAEAWAKLFPCDGTMRLVAKTFLASVQAHALFELGFEDHINDMLPQDRALIATQVKGPLHDILFDDAVETADDETRALLLEARQ